MSHDMVADPSRIPVPVNEPNLGYLPGSPERAALKSQLGLLASERAEIPLVIGGRDVRTGSLAQVVMPHAHRHVLADCHTASDAHVTAAIEAARTAWQDWSRWSLDDRAAVFLRAAELLSTTWRPALCAATMLGQSKTVFQSEIDAAAEMIDFWRFNAHFARQLHDEPLVSPRGTWNRMDCRGLEGFVYAVTPFNFTSIAGNLPTAPALMGNVVVWKPAATAMLSAHCLLRVLQAAGLPPGVINLVAGDAARISEVVLAAPDLAGVHFTGSTTVFQGLWRGVGNRIADYHTYPRLVGETGGKDFIVAHASADVQALAVAIVRGGFEYQGQKCSAASRVYAPASLWPELRERLVEMMRELRMGDVADFRTFLGAVIDASAFARIGRYQDEARATATIVQGGGRSDADGFFVEPTLVEVSTPDHRLMREEIFGPVVAVFVYDDARWLETLELANDTSPYALTGAVFARDRAAIGEAALVLRHAAGNFYVNDKPTGAVVGQQPFGGARASGTNDKAGSKLNLIRWMSARAIKETFVPPVAWEYPYMREA